MAKAVRRTPVQQLTDKLAASLEAIVKSPVSVVIYPAQGYYRKRVADVQAWTGHVRWQGGSADIGSWDTVKTCLRGFEVTDRRPTGATLYSRAYADFEVSAAAAPKQSGAAH